MSLIDIMREQADEKLARNYNQTESAYHYDYELELVKKLSLEESTIIIPKNKTPENQRDEFSLKEQIKQYEEDELLALYLQKEERSRVKGGVQANALKVLSPLEYKILNKQFGVDPEDEDNISLPGSEYNYIEPFELEPSTTTNSKEEHPILYDSAQKKEDMEIGHVLKRMPEKRVNAAPVALHHKPYATRNKGKVLVYGANRSRPTPKTYSFPLKNDQHSYGFIMKVLGGCRYQVFCYTSGRMKLCRSSGKLLHSRAFIKKGSIVLYRIRIYQESKGDIVFLYTDEEYDSLLAIGELVSTDPKKIFPIEIWKKILSYLDADSLKNITEVYKNKLFD